MAGYGDGLDGYRDGGKKDGIAHLSKLVSKRGSYQHWRRRLAVALFAVFSGGHVAIVVVGLFSCYVVE